MNVFVQCCGKGSELRGYDLFFAKIAFVAWFLRTHYCASLFHDIGVSLHILCVGGAGNDTPISQSHFFENPFDCIQFLAQLWK